MQEKHIWLDVHASGKYTQQLIGWNHQKLIIEAPGEPMKKSGKVRQLLLCRVMLSLGDDRKVGVVPLSIKKYILEFCVG